MGHRDRRDPSWECASSGLERIDQHVLVRPVALRPVRRFDGVIDEHRVEIGHGHDGHGLPSSFEDEGLRRLPGIGELVDARPRITTRTNAEADRRVMVARDQHDRCSGIDEAVQGVVQEREGLCGRLGTVVDIAGDDDEIDGLGRHKLGQPGHECPLVVLKGATVEATTDVPIAGVDDLHRACLMRDVHSCTPV